MSPKNFKLTFEALNEEQTFTSGDTIRGTLTFTLTEDTKVKSLGVKVKGYAHVHWTEGTGDRRSTKSLTKEYLKVKQSIVEKNSDGTVLPKGDHCHKFSLNIPLGDLPSSFKDLHGKVVYSLIARMSRSWKMPLVEEQELKFLSNSFANIAQCPVTASLEKGKVQMSATVDKRICCPGDTLSVVAKVCNSSSKKMKPKFSLIQKIVYRAHVSTEHSYRTHCKVVGETIASNSNETVSCKLTVPVGAVYTMNNCELITNEYYVQVYLDIRFAIDPEVVLPVVVAPAKCASRKHDESMGPYLSGPVGAPGHSDFPPPAFPVGPYPVPVGPSAPLQPGQTLGPYPAGAVGAQGYSNFPPPGPYSAPTGPGTYGYPAPHPAQPAPTTIGFNNQWPQQLPPYGYPPAAFPTSSVQPQAPAAQPQFQQGETPPTYMSLFPPPT
ncbi:arrestin domain-containing protein 3 [Labrus bergylta]|uniref:arrestin domain-containing protein 3 n=1 Tax=Labrus bergylta TaxID=56723 RepID=UPI0009B39907|nr:arrestin domain-containing protein 3-like [Labrus bergylta]